MVESQGSGRLFYYVNEVSNHFSPVIAAVFVLAVLWDGLKDRGDNRITTTCADNNYNTVIISYNYFSGVLRTCKYCNFKTSIKERGAFWGSMIGFSVGLLRLILLFAYPADPCVRIDKVTGSSSNFKFLDSS